MKITLNALLKLYNLKSFKANQTAEGVLKFSLKSGEVLYYDIERCHCFGMSKTLLVKFNAALNKLTDNINDDGEPLLFDNRNNVSDDMPPESNNQKLSLANFTEMDWSEAAKEKEERKRENNLISVD